MHIFENTLGLNTGQTFGDATSPANFEPFAIARKQHARYLWLHSPKDTISRAASFLSKMDTPPIPPGSFHTANADSLNPGVFLDGVRQPPPYTHQVDDNLFADIPSYMPLTVAASLMALRDVFGPPHPCQPDPLSLEKLDLRFTETRQMLGVVVDTRRMVVTLSPRRRQKLLDFLNTENWLTRKHASLRDIARLHGLLINAAEYCDWAKAQFFVIQNLLSRSIVSRYHQALHYESRRSRQTRVERQLPNELRKRTQGLISQEIASFIWNHNVSKLPITSEVHSVLRRVYKVLDSQSIPWEKPIGHIVSRDPAFSATTDASFDACGFEIPSLEIFCYVPWPKSISLATKLSESNPRKLHINELEFVGLLLTFTAVASFGSPTSDIPFPVLHIDCDNTSAVSWGRRVATKSRIGQRLLEFFAELRLSSPHLGLSVSHLAGDLNVEADLLSRPRALYSAPIDPHELSFPSHLLQICNRRPALASWKVFLPSPDLLSSLASILSSDVSTAVTDPPKNFGTCELASSIFSGSPANSIAWS